MYHQRVLRSIWKQALLHSLVYLKYPFNAAVNNKQANLKASFTCSCVPFQTSSLLLIHTVYKPD